jgi:purine-binding chemotaxis protein CheW
MQNNYDKHITAPDEISGQMETTDTATEMEEKYLTFWTDQQLFGVPITDVVQIVGIQDITAIPNAPHSVKGVINLRGSIIPIVDVRIRFKKEEASYTERTCIIVANINETLIGFVVDSVDAVTKIPDDKISSPPKMIGDTTNNYLTGVVKLQNKIVLLIDTAKLVDEKELDSLTDLPEN